MASYDINFEVIWVVNYFVYLLMLILFVLLISYYVLKLYKLVNNELYFIYQCLSGNVSYNLLPNVHSCFIMVTSDNYLSCMTLKWKFIYLGPTNSYLLSFSNALYILLWFYLSFFIYWFYFISELQGSVFTRNFTFGPFM
jgi:hypothetical protein